MGRDLEEDLSIHPSGIKDFGVHDLGDERQGKRSPLDVVMEFLQVDNADAFDWLHEQLNGAEANAQHQAGDGAADAGRSTYAPEPWPALEPTAFHGSEGEVMEAIDPHTEADRAALLLQYLACFGNVIGRSCYYQIEDTKHFGNLFIALAGDTSRSRKGTSAERIRTIFKTVDLTWALERMKSGVSSGEGIISQVRDATFSFKKGKEELIDPGVEDKRFLLMMPEFSQALAMLKREGSSLSQVLRDAWDGYDRLQTLTKHTPLTASNAHISIVAHITIEELRAKLDETAMANGFANRFLFACIKRSKELPFGGALAPELTQQLGERTCAAVQAAQQRGAVSMSPAARSRWADVYPELTRGRPGLLGHITARAEAQTVRLALLYALLDQSEMIEPAHLEAALAVWRFCEASTRHIFGEVTGDPAADTILQTLQRRKPDGVSKAEISSLFSRHRGANVAAALNLLERTGKARCESQPTFGRPCEMWFAI